MYICTAFQKYNFIAYLVENRKFCIQNKNKNKNKNENLEMFGIENEKWYFRFEKISRFEAAE